MRVAKPSFFILCLFLASGMFLSEAKAFGVNTYRAENGQPASEYNNMTFLQEGIICPAQNAILPDNKTEQYLQEEFRSCFKGNGAGKGEKGFHLSVTVPLKESLFKKYYFSFTGAEPIWLKVLSLRL